MSNNLAQHFICWTILIILTYFGTMALLTHYNKTWLMLFIVTDISIFFFYVTYIRFKTLEKNRILTNELQYTEQFYREQFANNSAIMLLVDPTKGTIIDANITATVFYGYPKQKLLTLNINQIIHKKQENTTKQTKNKWEEQQHILANGSIRDVEVASSCIQFKDHTTHHLIVYDITEHRQALEALNNTRDLLALFMKHSPFYAFIKEVTPTESRVILASDNFKQMLGKQHENIQGKTMADLYPPELAAKIAVDDRTVIASGNVMRLKEDFNDRNYDTIKFPIMRKGKTLVAGYIIDITEHKLAEAEKEKLIVQNRRLHKSESLGRMAGSIAHHFNNQLLAITMNLEMAKNTLQTNEEAIRNINTAIKATNKATEISNLMLTYVGQTVTKREPLELSDVCRRSLPILMAGIHQNAVWETQLTTTNPIISACETQIQQVITNLVTNASESLNNNNGNIRLAVKTILPINIQSTHHYPVDWQPKNNAYACVEVKDTGCGIPEKDIEKIFDPFYSTKFVGRGMGLAVVQGIVSAHQGGITVDSTQGKGTTIRVFLPISSDIIPQKPNPSSKTPETTINNKRKYTGTILVVDDEPAIRDAISERLKQCGFTVFTANDGIHAIEIFQQNQNKVNCVISDLSMPRMNGWATLTALRKLQSDIPVILLSGYSEADVMKENHAELPQAFFSKPFQFEEMIKTIIRVIKIDQ